MAKPFSIDQTWLQCIGCGYKTGLLEERKFKCPKCGDLYDVDHNFDPPFQDKDTAIYVFNNRAAQSAFYSQMPTIRSGVWRFKEWIMPFLPDKDIVSLDEGNVPIVRAGKHLTEWIGGDVELFIILEGMTPTGSFKDFGGTVMMSVAKAAGIKTVTCTSTGDTSAMLAAYATAAGLECVVILPRGKVTAVQLAQPFVHGAKIITLPGDFDDCMRVMLELVAEYGVYPGNSLNPARIEGHQATVFLIAQYFHWTLPDWIVAPVGNGSNCSSIGKARRLMEKFGFQKTFRILACQSEAANPLAKSWNESQENGYAPLLKWKINYHEVKVGETSATAARIGNPVSRDKVMREIISSHGIMETASEHDLNEAVAICGKDGYFVCPQTGIAFAGIRNAVKKGLLKKWEKVVVVSTATGLKFTETTAAHLQENIISASDRKTETVAKIMKL